MQQLCGHIIGIYRRSGRERGKMEVGWGRRKEKGRKGKEKERGGENRREKGGRVDGEGDRYGRQRGRKEEAARRVKSSARKPR